MWKIYIRAKTDPGVGKGLACVSKKPLLFNCPPRHLHVVTLLRTKCVVDDRALAGISEIHEPRRMKDGWWKSPTLRDGVSLKTPGGRQRETTSLISQVTDDGTNKEICWHY